MANRDATVTLGSVIDVSILPRPRYRQTMTTDPRAALDRFVAALEAHYSAVVAKRGDDDPAVDDLYYVLADAFEVYDEALGMQYGEGTPFFVVEEEDEDDDDDDDGDDEDDDEH